MPKTGEGLSPKSIIRYAQCIKQWQMFTKNADFAEFDKNIAGQFKDHLKSVAEEKGTTLVNQYHVLRHLRRFFNWLCDQKGYEKIKRRDIAYLQLSKNDTRAALEQTEKEIPTIDELRVLISSIPSTSEVNMRDRALICLFSLTGMRISAAASLPIRSFNRDTLVFRQSPNIGVKTKNSKPILTTFLPIDLKNAEDYFLAWFDYLVGTKGFSPTDPIFPSTDKHSNDKVSTSFWTTSGPAYKTVQKRFKEANLPAYNPHSFRHFASACLSEMRLTEIEKKACSMNFGHEDVGTTFGTYGYGNMTQAKAVEIIKKTKERPGGSIQVTAEQKSALKNLLEIL